MKILLALILSLSATVAQATVVTYSFGGVFTAPTRSSIGDASDEPLFRDLIGAGDRFTGRFTFDTAALPTAIDPDHGASYPLLGFELQGPERFQAVATPWIISDINVTDDKYWDYDQLSVVASMQLDSLHSLVAVLHMNPRNSAAFDGGRVPDGFDDFVYTTLFLTMYHFDGLKRDDTYGPAQIALGDQLPAPAPVPEPASAMLLLAGLAGLTALRRRA